jgi:hypothetical protein
VKSSSYRIASRAVNALGGGSPVLQVADMKRAAIWVVGVPATDLSSALDELKEANLEWRNRILLIFDPHAESDAGGWFHTHGAAVGTFTPADADESRYVVEGDAKAVRALRRLIEEPQRRRVIEIKKGAKTKYLAGADAATKNVQPFVAQAVECFQAAGIANPEAKWLTETLLTAAMRSYFRAGRRAIKS